MIQIVFYSLLLFKVLKVNFFLHKILWVHYSRTTKKKINFTTKGRAERFLLLSLSPSLCDKEHPGFGLVLGASQPRGDRWWEMHHSTTALSFVSSMKCQEQALLPISSQRG